MTSRRFEVGKHVRERRKDKNLHQFYGKIESEASVKVWNVRFFCKSETEERRSAQLTCVSKTELPQPVAEFFEPPSEVDKENSALTPAFQTPVRKENSVRSSLDSDSESSSDSEREIDMQHVPRRSINGKSILRTNKKKRLGRPLEDAGQRVLHPERSYDSDEEEQESEEEGDDDLLDDHEIIMGVERLLGFDEQIDPSTTRFMLAKAEADRTKRELIGKKIVVTNGKTNPVRSEWQIIDDTASAENITAVRRPSNEIGVVDLDFNKLAEADFPLVEILLRFWPGDATQQLEKLNSSFRQRCKGKCSPVKLKEFFTFFACLLAAAPAGFGGEKLWNPSKKKGIFPHPDLKGIMKLKRFKQIKACFADAFAPDETAVPKDGDEWSPTVGKCSDTDEWARLQLLVNDFNATMKRNCADSDRKCCDESMSPWRPRQSKNGNLPHISFIARKPKPMGTEFKDVACAETGTVIHLEIQRGKDGMKDARCQKKLGATTACTVRLAKATASPVDGHRDTCHGDSWFASVRTATEFIDSLNLHFIGHVKQSHKRFPKEFFEETMKNWPGGTHLVLKSCFGNDNPIAVGHKCNKRKVCMFIMTEGAELTTCGDPCIAKFRSDSGNFRTREVPRPLVSSRCFGSSGAIDGNNQIRQAELALEEHWKTNDGWFRCATTILGIATTNAFCAASYSFASECECSHLKAKDFASILCHELVHCPFPDTCSFGRNVVRQGEDPPQWFEMIPHRFNPNAIIQRQQPLIDLTNGIIPVSPKTGSAKLMPGWTCGRLDTVEKPNGAPNLPIDIREAHKQTKIHAAEYEPKKRHRPRSCKLCNSFGLKQRRPPLLCADCGEFFCHDVETATGSTFPRQCYWTHMCMKHKHSGLATEVWKSEFEVWNAERVEKCKESDQNAESWRNQSSTRCGKRWRNTS